MFFNEWIVFLSLLWILEKSTLMMPKNNLTKYLKWIYVHGIMDNIVVIKNYEWQFYYFEALDVF